MIRMSFLRLRCKSSLEMTHGPGVRMPMEQEQGLLEDPVVRVPRLVLRDQLVRVAV